MMKGLNGKDLIEISIETIRIYYKKTSRTGKKSFEFLCLDFFGVYVKI
jgi:hypothetical protein